MDGPRPAMTGDHAFPPELVSTHAAALRALARSLALDEHAADDVVQDTWLRAFTVRPPAREGLGGWLRRVAEGFALRRKRSEGRRAAREHDYARERPEAAGDAHERAETLRVVVESVLELEDPYRETVLLRWFESLSPREIAARTGTPVATVNSRLQRAHARLRERLSARLEGRDSRALLVPLFGLERASSACASGAAAAATILGVTMSTMKLAAAGAAVLIGVGAWMWTAKSGGERPVPPVDSGPAVVVAAALDEPGHPGASSVREGLPPAPAAPGAQSDGASAVDPYVFELVVNVTDSDGFPFASADVYMGLEDVRLARLGSTDWTGTLSATWRGTQPVARVVMQVQESGTAAGPLRRVELSAGTPRTLSWTCFARRPEGNSLGALRLFDRRISRSGLWTGGAASFTTDENGTGVFTEPWLVGGTGDSASVPTMLTMVRSLQVLDPGRVVRVVAAGEKIEERPRDPIVRGHVTVPAGTTHEAVNVALYTPSGGLHERIVADEDGSFVFHNVPQGDARLFVGGGAFAVESRDLAALAPREVRVVEVACRAVSRTTIVLRDDANAPVAGAHVEARSADVDGTVVALGVTDEEGRVPLALPSGAFDLVARGANLDGPSAWIARSFLSRPGESVPFTWPAALGTLEFTVPSTLDAALTDVDLRLWSSATGDGVELQGVPNAESATRELACQVTKLPAGTWSLSVLAPGGAARVHGPFVSDGAGAVHLGALAPDDPVELVLRARGEDSTPAGEPAARAVPARSATTGVANTTPVAADVSSTTEAGAVDVVSDRNGVMLAVLGALSTGDEPVVTTEAERTSMEFATRRQGFRVRSGPIGVAPAGNTTVRAARDVDHATFRDAVAEVERVVPVKIEGARTELDVP